MNNKDFAVGMTTCFFCGEPKQIILNTKLTEKHADHIRELNGKCIDHEPCPKCAELMKQGIMFLSVKDGESGDNPYRTGRMCVVKEQAVERMMMPELFREVKKKRMAYIEDSVWDAIGLP